MVRAILYLRLTSLKNFLLSRLRRLRQPKYLTGAIVGLAYFYFFFFRHVQHLGERPGAASVSPFLPPDAGASIAAVGSIALFLVFLLMWGAPSTKPGLNFSEAEIAFLFPAPLTRRGLVHYKVLSAQFTALLQSLLYALLFNSRRLFSGDAGFVIVAWWALLAIVTLHYQGSSLTLARLVERGARPGRRRAAIFALLAGVLVATGYSFWHGLQKLPASADLGDYFSRWIPGVVNEGPLRWLFWPFRLLVQPFLVHDAAAFALALAPVAGLLVLHYFWVVRMNTAFEDASIAHAQRQADRVAELRRTGVLRLGEARRHARRAPFDLARVRGPELAFLWKNLLSTARPWFTLRNWGAVALLLIATAAGFHALLGPAYWKAGGVLAAGGALAGAMALLYGPLLTRLDLRHDLANADILKTYPLPGWRILLGELLAPIVVLTGIAWLGLLAWFLGLQGHQPPALSPKWFGPEMRIVFGLCAAVVTPVVIAMELLIPNAVPLLFPSWFQTLRTPGGGIDLMGQRLIFGFGQVLVVVLALLPAAAAAALLVFVT